MPRRILLSLILLTAVSATPAVADFAIKCESSEALLNQKLTFSVVDVQREVGSEIRYERFHVKDVKTFTSRPAFKIGDSTFSQEYCVLLEGDYNQ